MKKTHNRSAAMGAILAAALLVLAGCSASNPDEQDAARGAQADAVTMDDAWVKAAEPGGMTSGFGTLENASDQDVTVVSVESSASPTMELHETVETDSGQMQMREVDGGFVVPAGGKLLLEPGGNHLMMMELPEAVKAGEDVTFTLTFSDDSTLEYTAVVKDYAGANEDYGSDGDHDGSDHGGSDHDDMDHSDSGHEHDHAEGAER